jgi:hypothetical protein
VLSSVFRRGAHPFFPSTTMANRGVVVDAAAASTATSRAEGRARGR